MKLYLSSYGIGSDIQKLKEVLPSANKKVAIILNALDVFPKNQRREDTKNLQIKWFQDLGMQVEELDLQDYFGKPDALKKKMSEFGMVWVLGGNVFVLRRAYKYSGFDEAILERVDDENFLYAGYSAGAVVLQPSLRGINLVDDPNVVPENYQKETIWDGLGIIPYSIAPHYNSNHSESKAINDVVSYYQDNGIEYKTLSDGDVILDSLVGSR